MNAVLIHKSQRVITSSCSLLQTDFFFKGLVQKIMALKAFQGNANFRIVSFSDLGELWEQINYVPAQAFMSLSELLQQYL